MTGQSAGKLSTPLRGSVICLGLDYILRGGVTDKGRVGLSPFKAWTFFGCVGGLL